MKRLFCSLLFILATCPFYGQTGAHRIGQVIVKGNGITANVGPGAKILVCVANTGCATAANIYLDSALTTPAANPVTADGSGNYNYYLASGCVDEQISSPGQGIVFVQNVCPFNGEGGTGFINSLTTTGTSGPSTVTLGVLNIPNYTYTLPQATTSILGGVKCDGTTITCNSGVISTTGGLPASPGNAVQFANAGATAFAADGTFTFNSATHALTAQLTNGTYNTDLFASPNNGASNLFGTLCASGPCTAITPPNSADTGSFFTPPASNQRYLNLKNGMDAEYFKNPGQVPCGTGGAVSSAHCNSVLISDPINRAYVENTYLRGAGPGTAMGYGANTTSYGTNFSVNTLHSNYLEADSRGIDQMYGNTMFAHSTGDKAGWYSYMYTDGGQNYGGDEGGVGGTFLANENATYFHGTITAGGTTGSNLLTTHNTSGQNSFTDGGYLLDITQGGTVLGAITGTPLVGSWGTWTFASSTMPVSTAWGTLNADSNSSATGAFQIPVSQTIAVTLGVGSSTSPGDFTTGTNACLVNGFMEQVQITAAPPSSGGVQSITFNTRYAWKAGALIMQGGMCGQMLTKTGATWRTTSPAVGSFSATQVVPAACSYGACNMATSGASTVVGTTGTSITQYPGAEIIGTNGGQSNTVQLGVNTAPWANGDVIEGPHPVSVALHPLKIYATQYTKAPSAGSNLFSESWAGVNPGGSLGLNQTFLNLSDGSTAPWWWRIVTSDSTGQLNTILQDDLPTANGFVFTVPGQTMNLFTGYQPAGVSAQFGIQAQGTTGSFKLFANTSGLAALQASNVAPLGTVGQISIVDNTAAFGQNVKSVSVSGDATLASTGALTLATVNSNVGACGDATHVSQITLDAKGRATGCTPVSITAAGSISLTTTGTSGVATLTGSTLNIPNYTYTLPQATTSILGGVKPDGTTCTTSSGVLTCPGTGGISGLTAGYIPQATSGTAIGNSLLDYGVTTASTFTFAAPVAVSGSGPSQLAFTYNATPLVPGSSTTAVYGVNSSGQAVVSEAAGAASRVCTAANGVCASSGIANVTTTVGTTAIGANSCSSAVTVTMTGVSTTSVFDFTPNADVSGTTGWGSTGGLTIVAWPTSNTLNYKVCNQTASSITPGASVTFNVGAR